MFGRKRRKQQRAEAAAAAAAAEATTSPIDEIDTAALADLPPWPGPTGPPATPGAAPVATPTEPPTPEPAPLRYYADGAPPTPTEPAPEPAPEPPTEPAPAPEPEAASTGTTPDAGPAGEPAFRFTPVDEPAVDEPRADGERTPAVPADGAAVVPVASGTRALAERMRTSQHEMAQLSMHMDAWMDQAAQLRTELIVEWDADGLRPGYTDLVVRAVARSLVRHPHLNASIRDDGVELLSDVHIGVTTSTDDDDTVHVIPDAARRSLKELVAAASGATTDPSDAEPTFVVTALGDFGVDSFTPVVLAPNVATLGIGRVRDETRWEGDRPVRASVMTLVLAWDHRAFGGVTAAEFLVEVREMLEQPYRLLVD